MTEIIETRSVAKNIVTADDIILEETPHTALIFIPKAGLTHKKVIQHQGKRQGLYYSTRLFFSSS
jgi:hypothetical protein